jgi:acetyl-CoA/propionyl-CoA carboxylase biotin carboxyl carrier protein
MVDGKRQTVAVEVNGRRIEVTMPVNLLPLGDQDVTRGPAPRRAKTGSVAGASGDSVAAPMQATVIKVAVEEGQQVETGEQLVVLEAMKMEQSIAAPHAGVVTGLDAPVGQTVPSGHVLLSVVAEAE